MYTLRPYQSENVDANRQAVVRGKRSIINVMPTGSGKTVVFAYITASAASRGSRVLTLTHRQEIFAQTYQKLYAFGISAGQIVSGRAMTKNPVQVAMVQTVVNRLHQIQAPDIIIIDEGHHSVAPTWSKVLSSFPNAIKLFYTATPERADGRGLGDICDCMIEGRDIIWMVANGYLTIPMIKHPGPEFTQQFHIKRGDFDKEEQRIFLTKKAIVGDVIEHHRKYLHHMPTISFVANLQHGAMMQKIYRDAGIKAQLIQSGQKYMKERKRACLELADGSLEILISCDVISEGFDVPIVAGCHLLRRTMSLGLYLQQAGRTLRPVYAPGYCLDTKPGRLAAIKASPKPVSYILDFVGNTDLHGHLLQRREWDLSSTKRDPRKNKPNITHCPRCGGVWPGKPRICPDPTCGYNFVTASMKTREFKIEQVAGQLVDAIPGLSQDDVQNLATAMATGSPQDKQRAMMAQAFKAVAADNRRKLAELAKLAGYKDGWVHFAWNHVKKKNSRSLGRK